MRYVLVLLALAGCGGPLQELLPVPRRPLPPPEFVCPDTLPVPPRLPPVVSIERLTQGYHELDLAWLAERTRGDLCAAAVHRLADWIREREPAMADPGAGAGAFRNGQLKPSTEH
jgi:hypothetical protein